MQFWYFLKNPLVQIISKLNSKSYIIKYLFKLHSTQFNNHYLSIWLNWEGPHLYGTPAFSVQKEMLRKSSLLSLRANKNH